MFRSTLRLLTAAGALAAAPPLAAQAVQNTGTASVGATAADTLAVEAVRFYRPGAGKTLVKTFVEVPYGTLASGNTGDSLRYQVTMRIADSTGLELARESWGKAVPSGVALPGVTGMEITEFALAPGRYQLQVEVTNPATGNSLQKRLDLHGWTEAPRASDLLLAPAMRIAAETDTVPQPGELRQGSTMITPAAQLRLTPTRFDAYYLLEAYNASQEEVAGSMSVSIIDSAGTSLLQTPAATVRVGPGGGVLKGQLPLEGLPSGRYTMRVDLALGSDTTSISEQFTMADLARTMAIEAAQRQAERLTDAGYFADMDETALDAAFEPLEYIAGSRELRPYDGLTVAGKRNFLTQFWQTRDPDSSTTVNEARQRFYGAIEFANREYTAGGRAAQTGWKTDRGRVFAKYGAPDEVYQRQQEGRAPPYLVWRYARGRGSYFIFADRTGLNNYVLVHTNDRSEVGIPTWQDILTPDAVRDIGRYLGVDFFRGLRDPDMGNVDQ